MRDALIRELPEASRLALAWASHKRDLWLASFVLDARLARIVLSTQEPLVAQIRLAWWRDQLRELRTSHEKLDDLIALIEDSCGTDRSGLSAMIDGWEALLAEPATIQDFVESRANWARWMAEQMNVPQGERRARRAATIWAFSDLATRSNDPQMRERALAQTGMLAELRIALPRSLRPLAVLGGLGRRSLIRGGAAMVGDRLSPLVALRLGIVGR